MPLGSTVVGLRSIEVGIDEVISATVRGFHNWNLPLARPRLQPGLELLGNAPQRIPAQWMQRIPAQWIELPIRVEETNDALWLLERLNQPIQQDAIKTTVMPTNAALVGKRFSAPTLSGAS